MEITHEEYLKALKTCKDYVKQVAEEVNNAIASNTLTIDDLIKSKRMSVRLRNALTELKRWGYVKVIDLDKAAMMKTKNCGARTYSEFLEITQF